MKRTMPVVRSVTNLDAKLYLLFALGLALALGFRSRLTSALRWSGIVRIFPTKAGTADGGAALFPGIVATILGAAHQAAAAKYAIALIKKSLSIAWGHAERQCGKHGCQTHQGKSHGF